MKKLRLLLFIFTLAIFSLASNISIPQNAEAFRGSQICEKFDENWEDDNSQPCKPPTPVNCYCEVIVES
jgi:hypothetical protein